MNIDSESVSRPTKKICTSVSNDSDITVWRAFAQNEPLGGVLTSKQSALVPSMLNFLSSGTVRIRMEDESSQFLPEFANCPDWAKTLMMPEYQVIYRFIVSADCELLHSLLCNTASWLTGWTFGEVVMSNLRQPD